MITIRELTSADYADYMDFIDLVFSQAHRPHDFRQLLPKLYRPTDEAMACHTALIEDGRIRAAVGLYPMPLSIGGISVPAAGIGAVATHARYSGQGYMRRVMERIIGRAKADGCALIFLSGERMRYARYGFEKTGRQYSLSFNAKRLMTFAGEMSLPSLEPWDDGDPRPVSQMQEANRARFVHLERADEDVFDILRSWDCRTDLALTKDGISGWISYDPQSGGIQEADADSAEALLGLLAAHGRRYMRFSWDMPELPEAYARELLQWSSDAQLHGCGNWRVLDWPRVLEILLNACPPPDGRLTLRIGDEGTFLLACENGKVRVREVPDASPDVTADPLDLTRAALGFLPPRDVLGPCREADLLAPWFPRPIGICRADEV